MPTNCSCAELFEFAPVEGRAVVASFDGGTITSDAGALLLGEADRAIRARAVRVVLHRHACCGTGGAASARWWRSVYSVSRSVTKT